MSFNEQETNEEIERLKARNKELEAAQADARKAPFFQEKRELPKERQYPSWTFACPGKSLEEWNDNGRPGMHDDGPLVAVNAAIGLCPDADVWLLTKDPTLMQSALDDFGMTVDEIMQSGKTVWTNKGQWKHHFERPKRGGDGVRMYYPNRKDPLERDMLGFKTRNTWSQTVPLGGVAIAIKMGAKRIRIFGADMRGEGYAGIPMGPNSWRDEEHREQGNRWVRDRRVMSNAILDCAEGGVLLQLGADEAEVPMRTAAPLAPKVTEQDIMERWHSLSPEQKKMAGNPTMVEVVADEQLKRTMRTASTKIAGMVAKADAEIAKG